MLARRQLNVLGIDADRVRDQIAAGRWVVRTPRVISIVTGELTFDQRCWLAVLHDTGARAASRHGPGPSSDARPTSSSTR
jgi:hypothetical protein